ncbi:MAG: SecDF P1 head subdomain-containing protein [Aquihabitans sp.]
MRHPLVRAATALALAVLLASCGGGSGSDAAPTTSEATTTTKPTYAGLTAADISFHPVEQILACDGGVPTDSSSTTKPVTADTVPAVDGMLCYVLGPEGGDGTDVTDTKVYADGVGIEVQVRSDSIDAMNELFNACFEATDACPASSNEGKGYVAIVVDGQVVSTPAIQGDDLASTPFVITGDFDKAQATNIAAAIND